MRSKVARGSREAARPLDPEPFNSALKGRHTIRCLRRKIHVLPPFQGLRFPLSDPGAAPLRGCPWLPSVTALRLFASSVQTSASRPRWDESYILWLGVNKGGLWVIVAPTHF